MLNILFEIITRGFLFFALHINNAGTFPPALSAKEEKVYLEKYRNGDMKAKDIIIEHNLRLVVYIAKRFENTGAGLEDLVSIGTGLFLCGVSVLAW